MNTTSLTKYAGALGALAVFSACSGGSAVAPSNAVPSLTYVGRTASVNGRLVTAARPNVSGPVHYQAILSDLAAKRRVKDFEYVISFYGSFASIFNYPKSTNQIGTINNVGGQGCTNVLYGYGRKTFWIVAGSDQITEYKV
ncbi:MAG TPA: hypothetical protein VHS56_10855, partial [Candidatus Cybelea sp.]|nr:hypothetical protein [Candidatus Cybelea sp.]